MRVGNIQPDNDDWKEEVHNCLSVEHRGNNIVQQARHALHTASMREACKNRTLKPLSTG